MPKITKVFPILALIATLGVAAGLPAHADEEVEGVPVPVSLEAPEGSGSPELTAPSISLLPTNEYVAIKAGEPVDKELTITNDSSVSYRFRLYAQPYTIDDSNDQYTFAFNTMNSYTSIYNWVTFEAPDGTYAPTATYEIKPGESMAISYRVTPPAAIPAGGQYSAIFAETINDEATSGDINGIYTISRVALLLYGRSNEGVIIDSAITSYSVPSFRLDGPITASAKVKSLGNIDVTTTYKLVVKSIFGQELYANTRTYPVLPETERSVTMTWDDTPGFGLFSVQFSVSTGEHVEDSTSIVLIFPIYMIIITISLLTIITIWIIMILKKRKERKSRLIV